MLETFVTSETYVVATELVVVRNVENSRLKLKFGILRGSIFLGLNFFYPSELVPFLDYNFKIKHGVEYRLFRKKQKRNPHG